MSLIKSTLLSVFVMIVLVSSGQSLNKSVFTSSYSTLNDTFLLVSGQSQNISGFDGNDRIGFFPFQTSLLTTPEISHLEFKVYPNPASGFVFVETKFLNFSVRSLEVKSVLGNSVPIAYTQSGSVLKADISDLTPGVYFIHLETANGLTSVCRLVVN